MSTLPLRGKTIVQAVTARQNYTFGRNLERPREFSKWRSLQPPFHAAVVRTGSSMGFREAVGTIPTLGSGTRGRAIIGSACRRMDAVML